MSILSRLEANEEVMLKLISEVKEARALAPDGWYDDSEIESEHYKTMLSVVLGTDSLVLLVSIKDVSLDSRLDLYLDDSTPNDKVNYLIKELEYEYGIIFHIAELFIVLMGLDEEI